MTVKGSNIDVQRRDDRRFGVFERCEVVVVHPHTKPHDPAHPEVPDLNKVTVQLIDRPIDKIKDAILRYDLPVVQQYHGKYQGQPWTPRIGDMVIVAWLRDDVGVVMCSIPSAEQEPVCRSLADDYNQEYVFKLTPFEPPTPNAEGNFTEFPDPHHPTCFKWWPVKPDGSLRLDTIMVYDCKNGHDCPSCDRLAPCNKPDDIKLRTWYKNFFSDSDTSIDLPWRFKFHHNSESVVIFDNDKTIHTATKKGCSTCGGSGCSGECKTCGGTGLVEDELCPECEGNKLGACSTCNGGGCTEELWHSHTYPEGTQDLHAGFTQPNKEFIPLASEDAGVRVSVVHPDDSSVDFSWQIKDFVNTAYIQAMKDDGTIEIFSPTEVIISAPKITLNAFLTEEVGDNQVDGACIHGSCSCPCGGAGGSCWV